MPAKALRQGWACRGPEVGGVGCVCACCVAALCLEHGVRGLGQWTDYRLVSEQTDGWMSVGKPPDTVIMEDEQWTRASRQEQLMLGWWQLHQGV